jgi:Flp pilus assembly protein protease CpaA
MLLPLTILVAVYDRKHGEIPNWVTWPLILAGLLAHFPGPSAAVVASVLLVAAGIISVGKGIGLGDIKLWLALLWMLPANLLTTGSIMMFAVMFGSAVLQILVRRLTARSNSTDPGEKGSCEGVSRPAAWRALVFMLCLVMMQMPLIQNG